MKLAGIGMDSVVWPWDIDSTDLAIRNVANKLVENGFDDSHYRKMGKGSKEHKASQKIMGGLLNDTGKTWLMLGSESIGKLLEYAHRIAALFAYSTLGAVSMYNPSVEPEYLDCDPSDEEVRLLWKSALLIVVNGSIPVGRKYRQDKFHSLILNTVERGRRVLWLEQYMLTGNESSLDILQAKMDALSTSMPNVVAQFQQIGSFLWIKSPKPECMEYDEMEA